MRPQALASGSQHHRRCLRISSACFCVGLKLHHQTAKEHVSLTPTPTAAGEPFDDELYVHGCHVVWSTRGSSSSFVQRIFTTSTAVLSATWCQLVPAGRQICIAERNLLSIYSTTGDVFEIPVPFTIRKVCAMSQGLLISRYISAHHHQHHNHQQQHHTTRANNIEATFLDVSSSDEFPYVFSLMHPLEEIKPVVLQSSIGVTSPLRHTLVQCLTLGGSDYALLYDNLSRLHMMVSLQSGKDMKVSDADYITGLLELKHAVTAHVVWSDATQALSPASHAFTLQINIHQMRVCLVFADKSELKVLRLDRAATFVPHFSVSATSAVATGSLLPARDQGSQTIGQFLLVLGPDGRVSLFFDDRRLYTVAVAPLPSPIISLSNAGGDRLSIILQSGEMRRITLPVACQDEAVSAVISNLLACDGAEGTKAVWHCTHAKVLLADIITSLLPMRDGGKVGEWQAFSTSVRQLFFDTETACAVDEASDWAFLQRCGKPFSAASAETPLSKSAIKSDSHLKCLTSLLQLIVMQSSLNTVKYTSYQATVGHLSSQLCALSVSSPPASDFSCTVGDHLPTFDEYVLRLKNGDAQHPFITKLPVPSTEQRWLVVLEHILSAPMAASAQIADQLKSAVKLMADLGLESSDLTTLPMGAALLVFEALHQCRKHPPLNWPAAAYHLIGRNDLSAQAKPLAYDMDVTSTEHISVQPRRDLRFPSDRRLEEVRRLLDASQPRRVKVQSVCCCYIEFEPYSYAPLLTNMFSGYDCQRPRVTGTTTGQAASILATNIGASGGRRHAGSRDTSAICDTGHSNRAYQPSRHHQPGDLEHSDTERASCRESGVADVPQWRSFSTLRSKGIRQQFCFCVAGIPQVVPF